MSGITGLADNLFIAEADIRAIPPEALRKPAEGRLVAAILPIKYWKAMP
jgi:hypothetical protein